jgi:hypothetical protein
MSRKSQLSRALAASPHLGLSMSASERFLSETELLRATRVPDAAYLEWHIKGLLKKGRSAPDRWDGPFVPKDGLHIRGESHHNLDGVWRRGNGGFVLMEAKGALDARHARHALKKLTRWMELAHGHNEVTWAWFADWWLTRHRSWESGKKPHDQLELLRQFVSRRLGQDWMKLPAYRAPAVHLVCSGVNESALDEIETWIERYEPRIASFDLWVLHVAKPAPGSGGTPSLRWHRLNAFTGEASRGSEVSSRFHKTRAHLLALRQRVEARLGADALPELDRAIAIMMLCHLDQQDRPGPVPYVQHPAEVALNIAHWADPLELELVIAGLLHDAIEDGHRALCQLGGREVQEEKASMAAAREVLAELFGARAAELVWRVTNPWLPDDTPKAVKNQRYLEHIQGLTDQDALCVKIADFWTNALQLHAVAQPAHRARLAAKYRPVMAHLLPVLRDRPPARLAVVAAERASELERALEALGSGGEG